MKQEEIINALWRIAKPSSKKCDGCGCENSCSTRGCAIVRAAVREIDNLTAQNKVLKEIVKNEKTRA